MNNLKKNSIDLTDVKFITRTVHEKTLKRTQVTAGDLIFAISGTKDNLGTVSIVPDFIREANLNSALVRLNLNESLINKKYFCLLFSLGFVRTQIDYIGKGAAQNNLNNDEISQIQIPIPSIEVQDDIVAFFEKSCFIKKQKEAEAAALLASIDGYLLKELGISLPTPSTPKKFFYTRANKVTGCRFDPFYHQVEFDNINYALKNSIFETHTLGHLTLDLKNGAEYRTYSDDGYRYLRVTDLSQYGINNKSMRFVNIHEIPERLKLDYQCILISRSGSLGLVNIVTDEIINSILSSHIFKVKLNTKLILPIYLESFLRSIIGQKLIFRENNGGVIPEINQSALKSIKILVPPIDKQNEIANYISALRTQAQALMLQASVELEEAKQHVEDLILGEKPSCL